MKPEKGDITDFRERSLVAGAARASPRLRSLKGKVAWEGDLERMRRDRRALTVRKTIDILIGTFCAERGFQIVHYDSDFDLMARHIGLDVI